MYGDDLAAVHAAGFTQLAVAAAHELLPLEAQLAVPLAREQAAPQLAAQGATPGIS
jgi:hypothetical protein